MNFDEILDSAKTILSSCARPSPDSSYLPAVSGGPDSVLLLYLLKVLRDDLQPEERPRIKVAHFNHGLRGDASIADENFVRDLCRQWQFDLVVGYAEKVVAGLSGSSETWAREQRHRFLQAERKSLSTTAWILLGHHGDDQLETMLINLGRGTGLSGLAAMPEFDLRSYITRPLLFVSRHDVMTAVRELRLSYRHDLSNESTETWRNKLRIDVIPTLREMFGTSLNTHVRQTTDILKEEELFLAEKAKETYQARVEVIKGVNGELLYQLIDPTACRLLPKAMRRRLFQLILMQWKGNTQDISYQLIVYLDDLLMDRNKLSKADNPETSPANSEFSCDLPFQVKLICRDGAWRFYSKRDLESYEGPIVIPVKDSKSNRYEDSRLFIYNQEASFLSDCLNDFGRFIKMDSISLGKPLNSTYNVDCMVVVSSRFKHLLARTRKSGDKMLFSASRGRFHKNLKQYMQERAVWNELRSRLLVIELDGLIVWIPGLVSITPILDDKDDQGNRGDLTELCFL